MNNKNIKTPLGKGKVAKVPVIMQLEVLECGAASLAMILAYYEKWIPLEQVRSDCGVSRNGSNAKNMLLAARNYGLETKAFRYEPDTLKEKGTFPCIIHWNFNHFVVLDGFKKNCAIINDPARGIVKVPMEEFDESFTGICLFFKPSDSFVPSGKKKSVLEFAQKLLIGSKTAVIFVLLTTIITALLGVINPVFSRVFLDRILTGKNREWVIPFLAAMAAFTVLQILVMWIKTIYSLKINGKMTIVGTSSYMWQIVRMPMEFFSQRMAGDLQSRMGGNAAVASTVVNTLAPLAINTVMMLFYLVVMVRYSPLLSLIGIFSVALDLVVSRYISNKQINLTRVQMRDAGKLAATTVSGIEMIETIKASGAENGFFEKWAGYQASVNTTNADYRLITSYLGMIPVLCTKLADILVLIIGVSLVFSGKFTVGMIMAFQGFLVSFTSPAAKIIEVTNKIQQLQTQIERVSDVMEYPRAVELDGTKNTPVESYSKLSGRIELKNVTFGYAKLADPLLEDFSMSLYPGKKIALVGGSGCGKSTIAKLVSGLYEPWSGEILFDGIPIKEINRDIFTGSLAVVDQDITLFHDTIANNIKMWDQSIEDFEMILAARDAQMHDVIMQREGGYEHQLMEGGKNLSGGQRQRLEIARVLAADPTIIILDEATSALDAKTEYNVVKSINDRGITCIIVAHRLSTIRDCDEIIVLDHGKVIERGTHEELYANDGKYRELISNE